MKKIKSFIAVIAAMVLTANTVGAATIDNLSVFQKNVGGNTEATITVSGTSEDEYVSLAVINPGMDEEDADPTDGSSVAEIYQLLKNVKVEDGKYSYTYKVTDNVGVFTLKVAGDDWKAFELLAYEEIDTFLDNVNGTTDPIDMVELFEDESAAFALDVIVQYEKNDTKLGNAIIAGKPYSDVEAAVRAYRKNAIALIIANPANLAEDGVALADIYGEELGLDELSSSEVYAAMTTADKKKVIARVAEADVEDAETFVEAFAEQTILTAVAEAESYGEVKELLDNHTDIIDIDWEDELRGVKATSEIYKALKGNYYESGDKLLEQVETLDATQKRKESKNSGSSGGSSGSVGVSSGSNTRIPTPQVTPAEDTVIFTDLESVAWAKASIYALAEKKILSGIGNGLFAPEAVVTREQFVQGIVNAFGFMGGIDPGFVDVNPGDWFYNSVCIAYANGIVSGIDETHFGVGQVLTREEMATLVYRAMEKKGYTFAANQAAFGDIDAISAWAKDAANAMYAEGIISGFPTGNFEPKGECTRAQMAVVLEKAMGKI